MIKEVTAPYHSPSRAVVLARERAKRHMGVRQEKLAGYSGCKSRGMKLQPGTYLLDPSAVTRESGREASVRVRVARAIERRKDGIQVAEAFPMVRQANWPSTGGESPL